MKETAMKICQAIFGVAIAVVWSALAWRFWNIDGYLAFFIVLAGLGMAAHAFGYKTSNLKESNHEFPHQEETEGRPQTGRGRPGPIVHQPQRPVPLRLRQEGQALLPEQDQGAQGPAAAVREQVIANGILGQPTLRRNRCRPPSPSSLRLRPAVRRQRGVTPSRPPHGATALRDAASEPITLPIVSGTIQTEGGDPVQLTGGTLTLNPPDAQTTRPRRHEQTGTKHKSTRPTTGATAWA